MRLARLPFFASIGLILLTSAGCYRTYSPYGSPYGTPYGVPGPPVQTLTPSSPYTPGYPQGTYPQSVPGSSSPTPADQFSTPNSTFAPNGSDSNAPFFKQNSNSPPPYTNGIPKYPDPGEEVQFQQQSSPKPVAEDFQLEEHGAVEGAGASTTNVAKVPLNHAEFQAPLRVGAQKTPADRPPGVATVASSPSPFAHDADGYRWLRGVARRNESTGAWSLVYNTVEIDLDPYQGWLTLAPDPSLSQLAPNVAFLISGELDESLKDAAGKPTYRVHSIRPWTPSATF